MSQSLLAIDTDKIKGYVFATNKLKEIRGASSLLDYLNRTVTMETASSERFHATTIYANGGSALLLVDAHLADDLGREIQQRYQDETGGGASITYAVQPLPESGGADPLTIKDFPDGTTMAQLLALLALRMRMAKEGQQRAVVVDQDGMDEALRVLPSHVLLAPCHSCGTRSAEKNWPGDGAEAEDPGHVYCQSCLEKRQEDRTIKDILHRVKHQRYSERTLWGRIMKVLREPSQDDPLPPYALPDRLEPLEDFQDFRKFSSGKGYLGLIYADANGMGNAIKEVQTLEDARRFAKLVDDAVFQAMSDAIRMYLPVQGQTLPFDILLIGGDDILLVTPADRALHVAHALAERFHVHTNQRYTLSVGVLLAPVNYPFALQRALIEETLKAAKTAGARRQGSAQASSAPVEKTPNAAKTAGAGQQASAKRAPESASDAAKPADAGQQASANKAPEPAQINFLVVTGNTSLSYGKVLEGMHRAPRHQEEFLATQRPYTLEQFAWLLEQLARGHQKRLGRTKLHQLREAILHVNRTTTILEALALLRNWREEERLFIKGLVAACDGRSAAQQRQETLFPWYPASSTSSEEQTLYTTPLLDFVELYDFVSLELVALARKEA